MRFKPLLALAVALAVALAFAPGAPARTEVPLGEAAEQIFAEFAGTDRPGCSVGIMRDGNVIHSFSRGMADIEARKPLDPRAVFNIASVSKQFTAFGVLLLEQRGLLSRDDAITKYVPELGRYARNVTLRHLLHHTGGLRSYEGLLLMEGHSFATRTTREQALEVLRKQTAANAPPGVEYDYSNTGYFLASVVIERVSGKSLRQFMQDEVFRPLAMADTTLVDRYPAGIERLARGYSPGQTGFDIDESLWEQTGDGQVHTTVHDLARWERNFLSGQVGGPALVAKLLETTKLASGKPLLYGSGVVIGEYRGLPTVRHGGDWAGYRSHFARFPAQRFAVAVLCNRSEVVAARYALKVAEVYLSEQMTRADINPKLKELQSVPARGDPARLPAGVYRDPETRGVLELVFNGGVPQVRWGEEVDSLHEVESRIFSIGESHDSFAAFIPALSARDVPRIVVQDSPQQRSYELARADNAARLESYVGTYRSRETAARFEVAIRDGRLVLESGGRALPLRPVAVHEFEGTGLLWEGEPFTLSFAPQPRAGLQLFTNGLRGLQFARGK